MPSAGRRPRTLSTNESSFADTGRTPGVPAPYRGPSATHNMSSAISHLRDAWLPRQLPAQLAALGGLYRAAIESQEAGDQPASVGWRLYAALAFASRLAPLAHLADLTGLTEDQLTAVLVEFADEDAALAAAA